MFVFYEYIPLFNHILLDASCWDEKQDSPFGMMHFFFFSCFYIKATRQIATLLTDMEVLEFTAIEK